MASDDETIGTIELELLTLVRLLETLSRRTTLYSEVDRSGYLALRMLDRRGPMATNALAETLQLDGSTVTARSMPWRQLDSSTVTPTRRSAIIGSGHHQLRQGDHEAGRTGAAEDAPRHVRAMDTDRSGRPRTDADDVERGARGRGHQDDVAPVWWHRDESDGSEYLCGVAEAGHGPMRRGTWVIGRDA